MPFTANYRGDTINSLNFSNPAWVDFKDSQPTHNPLNRNSLTCIECHKPMIARGGNRRISAHFAHRRDPTRACNFTNETREHLFLKNIVFQTCVTLGLRVEVEKRIETQSSYRIADICLPEKRKLIEIQLASKPQAEHFQRHTDYLQAGWDTLWLVWKNAIRGLPAAVICPQSNGNRTLFNKKAITTANTLRVRYHTLKLSAVRHVPICVMSNLCEIEDMIEFYVFGDDTFTSECPICHFPHWNDEKAKEIHNLC